MNLLKADYRIFWFCNMGFPTNKDSSSVLMLICGPKAKALIYRAVSISLSFKTFYFISLLQKQHKMFAPYLSFQKYFVLMLFSSSFFYRQVFSILSPKYLQFRISIFIANEEKICFASLSCDSNNKLKLLWNCIQTLNEMFSTFFRFLKPEKLIWQLQLTWWRCRDNEWKRY